MAAAKTLGEYVKKLKFNYEMAEGRRLSGAEMARSIGKSSGYVNLVMDGTIRNPDQDVLKALADQFGSFEDYRQMMLLAGYDEPELMAPLVAERIAAHWQVPVDTVRAVAEGRPVSEDQGEIPADRPDRRDLSPVLDQLPDEVYRRILEFVLFERHRLESQE